MKSDNEIQKTTADDRQIAELLKRNLPQAPPQPWFVRSVMNRLPGRIVRIASIIEYLLYIIGVISTATVACHIAGTAYNEGLITIDHSIAFIGILALMGLLLYAMVSPFALKRRR